MSIVTDNGKQFNNQEMKKLCENFHIIRHSSTIYYPQGNGQARASSKTIVKILKKTMNDSGHA